MSEPIYESHPSRVLTWAERGMFGGLAITGLAKVAPLLTSFPEEVARKVELTAGGATILATAVATVAFISESINSYRAITELQRSQSNPDNE